MNKRILLLSLGIVFLLQLLLPLIAVIESRRVLNEGREWKFQTEPIDPRDPFRGDYIDLRFNEAKLPIDLTFIPAYGDNIWISIESDANGWAHPTRYSDEFIAPGDACLEVKVNYVSDEFIYFDYPFDRYFMEETKAEAAETAYRDAQRDTIKQVWADVCILNGKARLKDLKLDGVSISDYVAE